MCLGVSAVTSFLLWCNRANLSHLSSTMAHALCELQLSLLNCNWTRQHTLHPIGATVSEFWLLQLNQTCLLHVTVVMTDIRQLSTSKALSSFARQAPPHKVDHNNHHWLNLNRGDRAVDLQHQILMHSFTSQWLCAADRASCATINFAVTIITTDDMMDPPSSSSQPTLRRDCIV